MTYSDYDVHCVKFNFRLSLWHSVCKCYFGLSLWDSVFTCYCVIMTSSHELQSVTNILCTYINLCHYDIPCFALISVWHYDIQTVNYMTPAFCVYINFSVSLWHSVCNRKFCITELSYITLTSGWHYDIWCVTLKSVSLTICVYINFSVSLWHLVCSG